MNDDIEREIAKTRARADEAEKRAQPSAPSNGNGAKAQKPPRFPLVKFNDVLMSTDGCLSRQRAYSAHRARRHLGTAEMRQELLGVRSLDACRARLGVSRPARQAGPDRLLRA